MSTHDLRLPVGWAALLSSPLYILSDLLELLAGGFWAAQLYLTYVVFMAIPFVVLGLHAIQQPRGGWLSLVGAVGYGASFIFFAGTVVYALARKTSDYTTMVGQLGALYVVHGVLMVIGGALFGVAVIRAAVLPRWTGILLIVGVILNLLLGLSSLPEASQIAGSTVRNIALMGMGAALVRRP